MFEEKMSTTNEPIGKELIKANESESDGCRLGFVNVIRWILFPRKMNPPFSRSYAAMLLFVFESE